MTAAITREVLCCYLDDALGEAESARVEQALRESAALQTQLRQLMSDRDRGEHSIGAIWRRQRLSCPPREQLGTYLLGVLEVDLQDYIEFHLKTIGCAFCLANLADLQSQQQDGDAAVKKRRKRYYQTSAGLLNPKAPRAK